MFRSLMKTEEYCDNLMFKMGLYPSSLSNHEKKRSLDFRFMALVIVSGKKLLRHREAFNYK